MNGNVYTLKAMPGYGVVPMHPGMASYVARFETALAQGVTAREDLHRSNFFTTEIDGVSYFFHVYPPAHRVYLLAAATADLVSSSRTAAGRASS